MLVQAVAALVGAIDDFRREVSDENAERVADAIDAILLRPDPDAPLLPQLEPAAPVTEGEGAANEAG